MRRIKKKTIFLALFTLLISYFLALTPVALKGYSVYQDAKSVADNYDEIKYKELVNSIDSLTNQLRSPLLFPIKFSTLDFEKYWSLYDRVKPLLPVAPELAGYSGPKKYLLVFQNPAESRGTGGIVGAFAVIQIDKGGISFKKIGANNQLQSQKVLPISMPKDFKGIYGNDPAIWQNANESPDFPSGAKIMLALWQRQFNENLDGVITLDPIVLSTILSVVGPVEVNKKQITSENVVSETLSNAYIEYTTDNLKRKQYLVQIIEAVANKLMDPNLSKLKLIEAMAPAIVENRILLYSAQRELQKSVSNSTLSGSLELTNGNDYRLVLINIAGNKMDYYITRTLKLTRTDCKTNEVVARYTIQNSASKSLKLPAYVNGRLDLGLPNGKSNSTSVAVLLFGPPGTTAEAKNSSTNSIESFIKVERKRPVVITNLDLAAGKSTTLEASFTGGKGEVISYDQPLVTAQTKTIVDRCKK